MGRSRSGAGLEKFISDSLGSQKYGRKLIEGMGMDPTLLQEQAPIDDGDAPGLPVILTTEPFIEGVNLVWTTPPKTDYVALTHIGFTKAGDAIEQVTTTAQQSFQALYELAGGVQYSFRIKHEDRWGRQSVWSAPVTATTVTSALDDIDVAELQLAGRLTNLMPALNANLLDPDGENFAEGVVNAIALAQSNNSNQLTLREVDFEMWRAELYTGWNGTWPPPEVLEDGTVINEDPSGNPYIVADARGHTPYAITTLEGRRWLRDTRPVGVLDTSVPFSNWSSRGCVVGGHYIYSAYVRGPQNATVRIAANTAADSNGASQTRIESQTFSLSGNPQGDRIHVKFQLPAGKPFVRMELINAQEGQTVYWSRFQLEATSALKGQPSPWSAGVFTTGVIGARMISTLDVSAVNAIFKNAAIEDAKIANLKADKILTGELKAGRRIVCLGEIIGGGAKLDPGGIVLTDLLTNNTRPADSRGSWITGPETPLSPPTTFAGIGVVNDSSPNRRGWLITAEGVGAGSREGYIRLLATNGANGDQNAIGNAKVILTSDSSGQGNSTVRLGTDVNVDRDALVSQDLRVARNFKTNGDAEVDGELVVNPTTGRVRQTNYGGEVTVAPGNEWAVASPNPGFPFLTFGWWKEVGGSRWSPGSIQVVDAGGFFYVNAGAANRVIRGYRIRT